MCSIVHFLNETSLHLLRKIARGIAAFLALLALLIATSYEWLFRIYYNYQFLRTNFIEVLVPLTSHLSPLAANRQQPTTPPSIFSRRCPEPGIRNGKTLSTYLMFLPLREFLLLYWRCRKSPRSKRHNVIQETVNTSL